MKAVLNIKIRTLRPCKPFRSGANNEGKINRLLFRVVTIASFVKIQKLKEDKYHIYKNLVGALAQYTKGACERC